MSVPKTKPTEVSPESHIAAIANEEQRKDARTLVALMLCGQFLPAQEAGTPEWTPFVTIKTSGYEQYIGAQAEASYCQRSSVIWDKESDLSTVLQSRLDSLR